MTERESGIKGGKEDNLTAGARGGAVAFVLKTSSTLLSFLNQIILARILGAGGLGEVMLALSVINISAMLAKFGMEGAMMRFIPLYIEKGDEARLKGTIYFALKFCIMLSVFFVFLVWLSSGFISASVFHSEGLLKLLPIAAVAIPANVLYDVTGGILRGYRETFRALLPQFLISPFLRLVIFLLLSIRGGTPFYAVTAFVAGEIIAMFFSLKFLSAKTGKIGTRVRKSEYREVLDVAFTMIFTGLSLFLFTQADIWIVGMFTTTESVGIYGVTVRLVTLVAFSLGAFSTIIPPIMSSVHASGDMNELKRVVRESTRWILSTAMPIILILTLEGNLILKYFFGDEFISGYTALLILCAGQLINAGSGLVGYLLQMTGGHRSLMKITVFWGILNVLLNTVLVPVWGIAGAALSTSFCLAMVNVTAVFVVYRKLSVYTLAKGAGFDMIFIAGVAAGYAVCTYSGYPAGQHLLLAAALVIYISRAVYNNDLPWRLLLRGGKP